MNATDAADRSRGSQSAAALHARLQAATRDARTAAAAEAARPRPVRRRVPAAATWAPLQALVSGGAPDRTLSIDRALRRILVAVIDEAGRRDARADLGAIEGPVIVIRSAPWPVLRAVLAVLKANERVHPVSVLCHRRDEAALAAVARDVALDLEPIFYPRFEPFNTATLRRLLDGGPWRSTVVLDGSKEGRGDALEHVTTAVSSRDACVWNAGGAAWRQPSLRERLDPASYALVRDLLRWRARRPV